MAKYNIIPSSRTIVQSPISIGHKAEKGVEAIEFDLTAWVETYGSGTLTVIMRRWGDAIPYPIALKIDENNKATWTLSDTDTAKAGIAYAQLSYIVGDEVVKKSDIYTFRVMDSLTGEGDPPEAYESWLENLTHLAAEAMAEVLDIEGIATDKTLTVDGGIADGKATGDALALKADKSTTYTKAEVDQMIEDVEVETDTTLSVSGAPADAAETGRQIGLLKADLDTQVADINESLQDLGMTDKIKAALLDCFSHVCWNNDSNGRLYYENIEDAMFGESDIWSGNTSADTVFAFYAGLVEGAAIGEGVATRHLVANNKRRALLMLSGKAKRRLLEEDGSTLSSYYLIPVPADAYSIEANFSPASNYISFPQYKLTDDISTKRYVDDSGWITGGSASYPIMTVERFSSSVIAKCDVMTMFYRMSNASDDVASNPTISYAFKDAFHTKKWIWKRSSTSQTGNLHYVAGVGDRKSTSYGDMEPSVRLLSDVRASFWCDKGLREQAPVLNYTTGNREDFYAIPIPENVSSISATVTPSTYYLASMIFAYNSNADEWHFIRDTGWKQESLQLTGLTVPEGYDKLYMTLSSKFNQSGTSGDLPTNVTLIFS